MLYLGYLGYVTVALCWGKVIRDMVIEKERK